MFLHEFPTSSLLRAVLASAVTAGGRDNPTYETLRDELARRIDAVPGHRCWTCVTEFKPEFEEFVYTGGE